LLQAKPLAVKSAWGLLHPVSSLSEVCAMLSNFGVSFYNLVQSRLHWWLCSNGLGRQSEMRPEGGRVAATSGELQVSAESRNSN
jgi:hypothetical protein